MNEQVAGASSPDAPAAWQAPWNFEKKLLRGVLLVIGCSLMTAALAAVLPTAWMAQWHDLLGLGLFPNAKLTQYLTRSIALLYAIHGALVLGTAIHIRDAWPLVPWIGTTDLLFGVGVLAVDIHAGMPLYWVLGEGPGIMSGGVLVLVLWWRNRVWNHR